MKGNRIKSLREEKSMNQAELAKILQISPSAVGMYERDEREPNNELTIKIADFFQVSTDYLLGKTDTRASSNPSNKLFIIPIVGRVPAGEPLLADENIEAYLPIDPSMYGITSPDGFFFLRVVGESMNKVIRNGSYALIKKQETAEDGDVIVAIINGNDEATLKRFKNLDNGFVMLEPDSTSNDFKPIIINLKETNFQIIGKVIGDFKKW